MVKKTRKISKKWIEQSRDYFRKIVNILAQRARPWAPGRG